ncbi:sugar ABC transporter substrate-binding protein [Streptomyces subrutilus]|uniref:sugar ABC transporter substrate-binding protein n=1 Tax=Streptomyces subrutilus TaxID=36818 RepID=UPI002E0DD09D|nr:sugar ABC transporter substrate-binding protein [Streptomyces subrutilus]
MSVNRNRSFLIASCTTLLLASALTACGQEGEGAADRKASARPTVCLVMKSLGNEYFQTMQKGAEEHAKQRGDLVLRASGIQNETDIDGQVAAINGCITDRADAIVVAPADSRALVAPLGRAVKAGVKVVNIDVKLDDGALAAAGLEIPFVGPDNTEGARLSGEVLGKALGRGAKVVILEGNPGAANAQQRKAGFEAAARAAGLEVVDSKTAHWETDEAYTVVGNWLTTHPDVRGVLASNDSMALGAVKAVQAKQSKVKIASFDNIEAVRPYVKDGTVVATVDQYAAQQAGDGIDQAMKAVKGEEPPKGWVKTTIKVVTAADLG